MTANGPGTPYRAWAGGPEAVIERHAPEVPDREVQLADGLLDCPGRAVIAHQPHRGFQGQSRREQSAHRDVSQARGDPVVIFGQKRPRLRPRR